MQNAQWAESSACPAGAGSGAAARASVGQRSPSKPAAACAAHSAPTTPDSKALMMSAYATRQPTRLRHKVLLLAGLRCMDPPGTQNSAPTILAQAGIRFTGRGLNRTSVHGGRHNGPYSQLPCCREVGREFLENRCGFRRRRIELKSYSQKLGANCSNSCPPERREKFSVRAGNSRRRDRD